MSIAKHIVANLIDQLSMKSCIQNSFKDYHAKGLWYIDLFRSEKMNMKLFFLIPELIEAKGVHLVNPHNHGYNFTTEVLYGSVQHDTFVEGEGYDYRKYTYDWYKPRDQRLIFQANLGLDIETSNIYTAGQGYYCDTQTIHSIIASDEPTCLLLYQFSDQELKSKDVYINRFAYRNEPVGYERFTPEEIKLMLGNLKKELGV